MMLRDFSDESGRSFGTGALVKPPQSWSNRWNTGTSDRWLPPAGGA